MSPDAVWQYGCTSKSAEPVSIQAPHHQATLSQQGEEGPFQAVETARCLKQANNADSVSHCLWSRPFVSPLPPNNERTHRWSRGDGGLSFRFYPHLCSPRHVSCLELGILSQLDAMKRRSRLFIGCILAFY